MLFKFFRKVHKMNQLLRAVFFMGICIVANGMSDVEIEQVKKLVDAGTYFCCYFFIYFFIYVGIELRGTLYNFSRISTERGTLYKFNRISTEFQRKPEQIRVREPVSGVTQSLSADNTNK